MKNYVEGDAGRLDEMILFDLHPIWLQLDNTIRDRFFSKLQDGIKQHVYHRVEAGVLHPLCHHFHEQ